MSRIEAHLPLLAMAAPLTNLSGASQILPTRVPKLTNRPPPTAPAIAGRGKDEKFQEHQPLPPTDDGILLQMPRRAALGLAGVSTLTQLGAGKLLAEEEEGNGLWLTGPLPVPSVTNKIANEETGTRSFLRKGIYMANVGAEGSAYRLRQHAFDLMGLGDMAGQDAWSYMRKYLCLKSTVMYYDFDKVIAAAPADQKQPLLDLANRLFDAVEKLEDAVKKRSTRLTESRYADTVAILQEVMSRMT